MKQDIRLGFAVVCPRRSRQLNTYSKMSIARHKIPRVNSPLHMYKTWTLYLGKENRSKHREQQTLKYKRDLTSFP